MEHAACHLYFLPIHTRLKAHVYSENTSDVYPTRKHFVTSISFIDKLVTSVIGQLMGCVNSLYGCISFIFVFCYE